MATWRGAARMRPAATEPAGYSLALSGGGDEGMTKSLKAGDKVTWDTPQGQTSGTVVKKETGTAKAGGHTAKATKSGVVRPSCRFTAATLSAVACRPRMEKAGPPGVRWTMMNEKVTRITSEITDAPRRLLSVRSIAGHRSLQGEVVRRELRVGTGQRPQAAETGPDQQRRVAIGQEDHRHLP